MPTDTALNNFITELKQLGFEGDIESSYAERVVAATDNSIYQLMPLAILYPRVKKDINRAMSCVYRHRHEGFSLCARGGGTGTNGQSLSDNLILDCSRHLNQIIAFDEDLHIVTVQPGVVLDQLNAFLKPYGLFFPIDISSGSRATLGGMVATDASGKGSLIYGKTSNHIESINIVLANGSDYTSQPVALEQMDFEDEIHADILLPTLDNIVRHCDEINRVFPVMNRGLTGYNLQQAVTDKGQLNPSYLIAGSEGTLGITSEIKLRVIPRPTHKILTVIFYADFQRGLEHVQTLLQSNPSAIEMLDDRILTLARNDSIWSEVKSVLSDLPENTEIRATNFVEHIGHSDADMIQHNKNIARVLKQSGDSYSVIMSKTETDPLKISALWNLRKRAVGLLGQAQNNKRGIAFVEDSAVPLQNLPDYISGFRDLLDEYGLEYGMYGHADAGVLHVRPALNLMQASDRSLIRKISDRVAELARQNGGVLWGEHGRGFRGEYTRLFFGETLYPVICSIKNSFDPFNLLNPGKLSTPDPDNPVIAVDDIMLRGELDAQISASYQRDYSESLDCNGNGACYNWQPEEAMCPSYKATRNKLYSPKGRAAMLREWVRLISTNAPAQSIRELEKNLHKSLRHCLSCKSCSSSCPLKVDIPELKSRFLQSWRENHKSSFSTLFLLYFDNLISLGQKFPALSNALLRNPVFSSLLKSASGLHKLPDFSSRQSFKQFAQPVGQIQTDADNVKAVIVLRDNYMQSFDQQTLLACCQLLKTLGYQVYVSDIIHNAKVLHVKGLRKAFKKQAHRVIRKIQQLEQTGLPLVSTETVMRLMFESEYAGIEPDSKNIKIHSIESFLLSILQKAQHLPEVNNNQAMHLYPHCQEQTSAKESSQTWREIFKIMGIQLDVINAGCCGMSGMFGHEVENEQLCEAIFNLSWKPSLQSSQQLHPESTLVSGFSCRCQCHNHNISAMHPAQYLVSVLNQDSLG